MIAYEIQLWYVIRDKNRDKIQSEKKSEKKFCSLEKIVRKRFVSDVVSDFQCAK